MVARGPSQQHRLDRRWLGARVGDYDPYRPGDEIFFIYESPMDFSTGMIDCASGLEVPGDMNGMVVQGDAFRIPLASESVDFVACMRFVHHLSMSEYRRKVLDELRRVSRRHVAVSLWVDGNFSGNRRLAKSPQEARPGYGGRHCFERQKIEAEFRAAGFQVVRWFDVWPGIGMWRLYLLERS